MFESIFTAMKEKFKDKPFMFNFLPKEKWRSECRNKSGGCTFCPRRDNTDQIPIYIEPELDDEMKVNVLFHEIGHALYCFETYKKANGENVDFEKQSALHAFKIQLEMDREAFEKGNCGPLLGALERIPKNSQDEAHEWARRKIIDSPLWTECKKLASKKAHNRTPPAGKG